VLTVTLAFAALCRSADPQAGVLLKTGVVTGQDLLAALERTEAQVLRNPHRRRIRLIVIDSIANVFTLLWVQGVKCDWCQRLSAYQPISLSSVLANQPS